MRAGFWEILLIVVLVLILFGHSKIPDLMKNLASGINVFKKELSTKPAPEKKVVAAQKPVAPRAKPAAKKSPVKKKK